MCGAGTSGKSYNNYAARSCEADIIDPPEGGEEGGEEGGGEESGGGDPTPLEPVVNAYGNESPACNDMNDENYASKTYQSIFISENSVLPNLGSLETYDLLCNEFADAAGLEGVWKALMSDETTDAKDRLNIFAEVRNSRQSTGWWWSRRACSGDIVASGAEELWNDGISLFTLFRFKPDGTSHGPLTFTMTGSRQNGTKYAGRTCNSWSTNSGSFIYGGGAAWGWDQYWLESWSFECDAGSSARKIYCINGQEEALD